MTDDPRKELDGLLGAAVRELTATQGGDQPPADLNDAVLLQFSRKGEPAQNQNATRHQGFTMITKSGTTKNGIVKYGLAASILVAIVGALSVLGIFGDQSTLHAQVAERVEKIRSLVCRVQWVEEQWLDEIDHEFGLDDNLEKKVTYLAPSRHRIEDPAGGIHIIDSQANKTIFLNTKSKEALVMQGTSVGDMASLSPVLLIETLRNHFRSNRVIDEGVHKLGIRQIDGNPAIGLRSTMNGEVVEAWVNSKTHLPMEVRVRLVIPAHLADGKKINMWHVMTNFEYDIEVDEALMSLNVPQGYTQLKVSMPAIAVDRSQAKLNDLISVLRLCATHNDSLFPLSLTLNSDEGSCMAIMKQYARRLEKNLASGTDAERKAAIKSVTEFGAALGRSTAFMSSIKPENDLRYFAGARLNQKNRPLLWYTPAADDNYKVVYADLTTKDATKDTLPPEPVDSTAKQKEKPGAAVAAERWSTPTFKLPSRAVRVYASLQDIRSQGKQKTIKYMVLGWMPELIESPPRPADIPPDQPRVFPEGWKPDRSPDSARLAFLSEFPNLKGLQLDHLYLTQKDLDIIGQCKKLERLSFNGVQILEQTPRRLSGDDLQKIAGLTNLKELDLGQSNFVGGLHFLSALPQLRKLYFGSFENLNDKSVAELQVLPHLETLILAPVYSTNPDRTVTDVGLLSLQKIPKLKTLYVGWHGKWTMPAEKLRELLPKVTIKAGH